MKINSQTQNGRHHTTINNSVNNQQSNYLYIHQNRLQAIDNKQQFISNNLDKLKTQTHNN